MAERNAGFSFFTFIFLICISNNAIGAFNLVGTHPYASINWHGAGEPCDIPNRLADGRTIKSLQAYDGGIYSGYGDWRCNTGPIRLCKFNPSSNTFSCEFTQATESIARFRVLNGDLYSVSVDPQPPNALGHAYAVKKNGVWSSYSAYQFSGDLRYYPVHAYDMNTYGGSLWFFSDHWTGETANDLNGLQHPRAWRSNNNGSSWFDALSLPQYGTAQIFCFGETLNGKLYVQAAYLGVLHVNQFQESMMALVGQQHRL